jgi:pimeloyl-ACP methyl ester carboxylesterase
VADVEHDARRVNGMTMHYVRAGQGPPLVLLHGWGSTWYMWRRLIAPLAERFTVIAPDLRGLGDSSKELGGYDKLNVARDVHALVEELELGPIHLVGHDWGGWPTSTPPRSRRRSGSWRCSRRWSSASSTRSTSG